MGNGFYFSQLEPNHAPVKRACARNPDIVTRGRRRIGSVPVRAFHPRFVVDYFIGLKYNFIWCRGKKSAPGFRCRTRRVRHHERHGKDERREKDECNGKANGEQRRRPAVGTVLAKRSHVAEAQQVRCCGAGKRMVSSCFCASADSPILVYASTSPSVSAGSGLAAGLHRPGQATMPCVRVARR